MKPITAAISLFILVIAVGLFLSYLYVISPKTEGVFAPNKQTDLKKIEAVKEVADPQAKDQMEDEARAKLLLRLKSLENINASGTTSQEISEEILTKEEQEARKALLLDRLKSLEN
jgi:hypothetical protein